MFKFLKDLFPSFPSVEKKLKHVCEINIKWHGFSNAYELPDDYEANELITVHVYDDGNYTAISEYWAKRFKTFDESYDRYFKAYKETKDVSFIKKWIVWEAKE